MSSLPAEPSAAQASATAGAAVALAAKPADPAVHHQPDRVLCQHCGRTASNDISCQGICVADSGY
ncbi:hypothetical protein [Synechococcus sp. CS-1328]|uniref:hypothetical protein n=1 Tax=Synechococcus sp. CS-1328 TaxID=2847976 RepID=UPI00223BDD50|nr:hypothetical protein [Synechococcus sp. CS-1328]MCT0225370.1 hypothetical protein [Synechococcus sp. CS-1328]